MRTLALTLLYKLRGSASNVELSFAKNFITTVRDTRELRAVIIECLVLRTTSRNKNRTLDGQERTPRMGIILQTPGSWSRLKLNHKLPASVSAYVGGHLIRGH